MASLSRPRPVKLNAAARLASSTSLDLLAECQAVEALPLGIEDSTYEDFNKIMGLHLVPVVSDAKRQIAAAVKITVPKLKSWALTHLNQAKKLRRPTALFEKVLNDPHATSQQLAARLLGTLGADAAGALEQKMTRTQEEDAIDDVLKDIQF